MQPLAAAAPAAGAERPGAVPSGAFAALSERDVAPDALFFHKYYSLAGVQVRNVVCRVGRVLCLFGLDALVFRPWPGQAWPGLVGSTFGSA